MEWYREGSVVRAGLALNGFRLLRQYDELSEGRTPDERYEATLTLCVLQSLLTNCWEFHKSLNDRQRKEQFESVFTTVDSLLKDPDVRVDNQFPGELKPSDVLEHLRNALSHPALRDTKPSTTGYTTVIDPSGLVTRLRFIDSPDLNSKGNLTQDALRYLGTSRSAPGSLSWSYHCSDCVPSRRTWRSSWRNLFSRSGPATSLSASGPDLAASGLS